MVSGGFFNVQIKNKKLCIRTRYNLFIRTNLLEDERTSKQSTSPINIWKLVGVVFDQNLTKYYPEKIRLKNFNRYS